MRIFLTHDAKTSLLQDYAYYDVSSLHFNTRTRHDLNVLIWTVVGHAEDVCYRFADS